MGSRREPQTGGGAGRKRIVSDAPRVARAPHVLGGGAVRFDTVAQFDVAEASMLAVPNHLYYVRYPPGFGEYLAQSEDKGQFEANTFLLRVGKNCYGAADTGWIWHGTLTSRGRRNRQARDLKEAGGNNRSPTRDRGEATGACAPPRGDTEIGSRVLSCKGGGARPGFTVVFNRCLTNKAMLVLGDELNLL